MREAPINLLDEATSTLDAECEPPIQDALLRHGKDCTVFAFAHRLSTLPFLDPILLLNRRRRIEYGAPELLRHKDGPYRRTCGRPFLDKENPRWKTLTADN